MSGQVPVALCFFRRWSILAVLARVRLYAPAHVLLVGDCGRNPEEQALVLRIRAAVEAAIDWPCRIETRYAERNLGCRRSISTGLDWVFERCERAMILEDDCVPSPQFFPYVETLLDRYAEDERVAMIGSCNLFANEGFFADSYGFSGYAAIWGWATWRRAWRHYDHELAKWDQDGRILDGSFLRDDQKWFWRKVLGATKASTVKSDTWDTIWQFSLFVQGGLCVLPKVNLVTNIGWGQAGTNTTAASPVFAEVPTGRLDFPLRHPAEVTRNAAFDERHGWLVFYGTRKPLWNKAKDAIGRRLPKGLLGPLRQVWRRLRGRPLLAAPDTSRQTVAAWLLEQHPGDFAKTVLVAGDPVLAALLEQGGLRIDLLGDIGEAHATLLDSGERIPAFDTGLAVGPLALERLTGKLKPGAVLWLVGPRQTVEATAAAMVQQIPGTHPAGGGTCGEATCLRLVHG